MDFHLLFRHYNSLGRSCRNRWCYCEEVMSYEMVCILRVIKISGDGLGWHHFSTGTTSFFIAHTYIIIQLLYIKLHVMIYKLLILVKPHFNNLFIRVKLTDVARFSFIRLFLFRPLMPCFLD